MTLVTQPAKQSTRHTTCKRPMKYMTQRGDRYYLHWGIPKDLRHLFGGRSAVTRTLHTTNLSTALFRRDLAVAELATVVRNARSTDEHQQFHSFIEEIRLLNGSPSQPAQPVQSESAPIHPLPPPGQPLEQTMTAQPVSPLLTPTSEPAQVFPPMPTNRRGLLFKEAVRQYLKENQDALTVGAISRLKMAPALFLQHLGLKDIHLEKIDKRDVQSWVIECCKEKATITVKSYVGALSGMWEWAYRNRKVDGENPFRDLNLRLPPSKIKRGAFTVEQVAKLLEGATPGMRVLMEFALITGCRLGELTTIMAQDFSKKEEVHYFQIADGKTENAARAIPLPAALWLRLKEVVESGLWVREKTRTRVASAYWSAMFQKLKGSMLGGCGWLSVSPICSAFTPSIQPRGISNRNTLTYNGRTQCGQTLVVFLGLN